MALAKKLAGILYGVGVGPGDPELMTFKAARLIKNAPVLAYPILEKNIPIVGIISAVLFCLYIKNIIDEIEIIVKTSKNNLGNILIELDVRARICIFFN